jgi:hypothetical protein
MSLPFRRLHFHQQKQLPPLFPTFPSERHEILLVEIVKRNKNYVRFTDRPSRKIAVKGVVPERLILIFHHAPNNGRNNDLVQR